MSANAPASAAEATATTDPGTVATPHPVGAICGAPTAAASAWASSRNGGSGPHITRHPSAAAVSSCQPIWPPLQKRRPDNPTPLRFLVLSLTLVYVLLPSFIH